MSIPTLTLRSIKNKDTGIDISSPSVQEVEAPLGGISVEYEIAVVTRLPVFKTQLHKNEDIVHFSVYKAYREVEDLHSKLQKKYNLQDIPSLPKQRQILSTSTEDKRIAIDSLMVYISKSELLSNSSIFIQFLGVSPQRHRSLSNAGPNEDELSSVDKKLTNESTIQNEEQEKNRALSEVLWPEAKEKPSLSNVGNIDLFTSPDPVIIEGKTAVTEDATDKIEIESKNVDDLFLKVKDYKQRNQHPLSNDHVNSENKVITGQPSHDSNNNDDDVDLFEEVQRIKESQKTRTGLFDTERKANHGLFDGIDDGSSAFFGFNVSSKGSDVITPQSSTSSDSDMKSEASMEKASSNEILPSLRSTTVEHSPEFSVSRDTVPLIPEQRKLGDISLFQEQDLGDSITVDEEPLFLVSQSKGKGIRKNPLLSPKAEVADIEISQNKGDNDNLDDLLNLAPLPPVPKAVKPGLLPETPEDGITNLKLNENLDVSNTKSQESDIFTESLNSQKLKGVKLDAEEKNVRIAPEVLKNRDLKLEPQQHVTVGQQISSDLKCAAEVQPQQRPVPMPRSRPPPPKPKEKPQVLPRKASLGKPSLPPKPVPPPKPKPPNIAQKPIEKVPKPLDTKSTSSKVQKPSDEVSGRLNSLDILQYIEQEEKSSLAEANLFD